MIKPILFNVEMVQAILDRRKTVTRRVIKPQPWCDHPKDCGCTLWDRGKVDAACPEHCIALPPEPYQPGDILYVRETWAKDKDGEFAYRTNYGSTEDDSFPPSLFRWRPSIHMPKAAARIWLKVTDVRVERLQDITPEEAVREGAEGLAVGSEFVRGIFSDIWDSTIKKSDMEFYSWDADPWVWVIAFERCQEPEET